MKFKRKKSFQQGGNVRKTPAQIMAEARENQRRYQEEIRAQEPAQVQPEVESKRAALMDYWRRENPNLTQRAPQPTINYSRQQVNLKRYPSRYPTRVVTPPTDLTGIYRPEGGYSSIPIDQPSDTPSYYDFNFRSEKPTSIPVDNTQIPTTTTDTKREVNRRETAAQRDWRKIKSFFGSNFSRPSGHYDPEKYKDTRKWPEEQPNQTAAQRDWARIRHIFTNPVQDYTVTPGTDYSIGRTSILQQGGQVSSGATMSEEELMQDFAVRYLTARGAEDVVDQEGNLNEAYVEEITEVLNNGIDWESYIESPDEYIEELVMQENPEAVEMARKGAKLRRLRSLKFTIK